MRGLQLLADALQRVCRVALSISLSAFQASQMGFMPTSVLRKMASQSKVSLITRFTVCHYPNVKCHVHSCALSFLSVLFMYVTELCLSSPSLISTGRGAA